MATRKPNWPPNLRLRGTKFYVEVRVPESLRGVVAAGRGTHLRRSLRTSNEAEALRRYRLVVADLKAVVENARREPDGARKGEDPSVPDVAENAAWWRAHLMSRGVVLPRAMRDEAFSMKVEELRGDPIGEEYDDGGNLRSRYDPEREERASHLHDLVTGERVPIATELERFFGDKKGRTGGPLSSRYVSRIRRAVRGLGTWLAARGGDNVAGVTRYEAGLYAEHLGTVSNTAQTASSLLTALSSYWRWLVKRGAAQHNPWKDQAPEQRSSPADADKRPYTDDEVKRLLSGDTFVTLHDMMRIAALSGLRINEIGRLTVAECADGVFNITKAKTAAGVRRVPIHSALAPILARRLRGKEGDAYLIEELSARKDHTGDRAGKASERFTAYRRTLGIEERKPGQRQSNVDFHSFRRWFVTAAEQAGQAETTIAALVGHKRAGITFGKYSGGPSDPQHVAVVESVHLPKGTPPDKHDGARMGDGRWPQGGKRSAGKTGKG